MWRHRHCFQTCYVRTHTTVWLAMPSHNSLYGSFNSFQGSFMLSIDHADTKWWKQAFTYNSNCGHKSSKHNASFRIKMFFQPQYSSVLHHQAVYCATYFTHIMKASEMLPHYKRLHFHVNWSIHIFQECYSRFPLWWRTVCSCYKQGFLSNFECPFQLHWFAAPHIFQLAGKMC